MTRGRAGHEPYFMTYLEKHEVVSALTSDIIVYSGHGGAYRRYAAGLGYFSV